VNVGLPSETIRAAAVRIKQLERENAALREQNENLADLLFRVMCKLDKNDPLRIHCLDYLKKIGRTLNPFRATIDAARKETQNEQR
jgi:predicted DNA-binding ribbon-helix-helix protein